MKKQFPNKLKSLIPAGLLAVWRRLLRSNKKYRHLSAADTFASIYKNRLWGQSSATFDSGEGSGSTFAEQYSAMVSSFVAANHVKRVVDLGCGDFRIGRLINSKVNVDYVGVDIVPDLIEFNQRTYGGPHTRFECRDIISDDLPEGDVCLVRQVLQHLSNSEIERILHNCHRYSYVIITEHLYCGPGVKPNVDKPHGPDIRVYERSGVFLDQPPFNRECQTILDQPYAKNEVLRTVLLNTSVALRQT